MRKAKTLCQHVFGAPHVQRPALSRVFFARKPRRLCFELFVPLPCLSWARLRGYFVVCFRPRSCACISGVLVAACALGRSAQGLRVRNAACGVATDAAGVLPRFRDRGAGTFQFVTGFGFLALIMPFLHSLFASAVWCAGPAVSTSCARSSGAQLTSRFFLKQRSGCAPAFPPSWAIYRRRCVAYFPRGGDFGVGSTAIIMNRGRIARLSQVYMAEG